MPKSTLSWLCVQQVGGWSKWSWQMAAFVCIMCVPECLWVERSESAFFPECCREVIVSCASSSDRSDQKHYQVKRQPRPLSLRLNH